MRGIFANRWWIVFATVCGLIVGGGAVNVFAFGVFLKPITADLGVGRAMFSSALTMHAALAALSCPAIGWLVDRWGARRIMIPGLLIYAGATACYALIQASPFAITFLIFGLTGIVGGVGTPIPYAAVITQWFDRQRGLALGIGIAGVGLGVALVPQLAAALIAAFDWRTAYLGLGIAILVIAFVPVAFFVLPMIGIALLATGATGVVPYVGAVALGLGIGAEVDLMAFFTSRYFGARNYAKIYGTMFGIFAFGVGIGPALSGGSFDLFRSYTPIFMVYEVFLAVSCVIFFRLGPYPYPAREPAQAEPALKMPA